MASSDTRVTIEGRELRFTSLGKVMYPEIGTTKADGLAYYAAVAPVMLPHVRNRPATRKRWVDGVGTAEKPGPVFFQKNLDASTPQWVERAEIQHSDHVNEYPLVNDAATLAWLAQIGSLEIHVPQWRIGRAGKPKRPDRLVLDLDPGPGVGLLECAEVARLARSILKDIGLDPLPVTSGSKGIHLYSALDGTQTSEEISSVAHELARALEADHPELIVSDMKKSKREGRVLVDWSQNSGAKTTVAPYSLRGRSRPMVAAPRTWRELASPTLAHLDHQEVMRRVRKRGDLLAPLEEAYTDDDEEGDRLATYRSMRDARRTPEPVPESVPPPTDGRRFVIQEHHARRLHFAMRLELLASLVTEQGVVLVPPAFDGDLEDALTTSRELDLEGIMDTRRDSVYRPGRRSSAWVELKHVRTQSVVVGGWRPGSGRRADGVGSLLVGVPEGRGLAYAGRVGSGFGERELGGLRDRLRLLETSRCPFTGIPSADAADAVWVRPELVGEVAFTEWTATGRLRHPVWRGWRSDIAPGDVTRE